MEYPTEEWREIPGYPGFQASSFGRILGKKGSEVGCFTGNYVVIGLGFGKSAVGRAHMIAAAFLPPKPFPEAEINHIDLNKHNDAPSNLEWEDRYNQMAHRGVQKNSQTGVRGLSWEPKSERWRCCLKRKGVQYQKWFHKDKRQEAEEYLRDKRNELGLPIL